MGKSRVSRIDGLTIKQRAFVLSLRDGMTLGEAYGSAYNPKTTNPVSLRSMGAALAARPMIKAALQEYERVAIAKMDNVALEQGVSRERISRTLAEIAFCGGRMNLIGAGGKPVETLVSVTDIRLAAMDLAKLHGYIIERKQVRVIKSLEDLSDEELVAIVGPEDGNVRH